MHKKKIWVTMTALFTLCASLVIVYASMRNTSSADTNGDLFSDVTDSDWFSSDVRYVNDKGLMSGTDENAFSPNKAMTRAMIVTVLWRLEGQPEGANISTFNDVKTDSYYFNAVAWAADKKIVEGYAENVFGSDDDVTREQLAAIFYRLAQYKGYDTSEKADLGKYTDSKIIADYAMNAFEWAIAYGIITGTADDKISPKGNALRCQAAAILKRFCEAYAAEDKKESEKTADISAGSEKKSAGSQIGGRSDSGGKASGSMAKAAIKISEVSASPGEDIRVVANIENNPGILGMTLTLTFDGDVLELKKAENGDALRGALDFTVSKTLSSGSRFIWDGIDITDDMIKDGEILTMDFHVSENAQAGKYPVTLSYVPGDIVDNSLSAVDVTVKDGYIDIKK